MGLILQLRSAQVCAYFLISDYPPDPRHLCSIELLY